MFDARASGGRIAVVSHCDKSGKIINRLFVEYLRYKAHADVRVELHAVGGRDTGAFLAAVLEGVEAKIRESCNVEALSINAKNAALFTPYLVEIVKMRHGAGSREVLKHVPILYPQIMKI